MVFTDPPYNVAYEGKTVRKLKIDNDALGVKFYEFLREACANLIAVCKGAIYVCMSSSEVHTLYRAFSDAGVHRSTFVNRRASTLYSWQVGLSALGRTYSVRLAQRSGPLRCGDHDQGDVWSIERPMANLDTPP